jgi:hypothetical protein
LAFIHDIERLARLNPLVIAIEKGGEENVWKVTDRILLLGFIPYRVVYEISAVFVEDGVDVDVSAPMGIRSFSKWRVTNGGEKGYVVTEEASVEAHPVLLSFIKLTLKQSHEEMLERMEQVLVGVSQA